MKKTMCVCLALVLVLALAACGGKAASEVGTYSLTDVSVRTIEQGKLATSNHNTISVFSDNTFIMTAVMDTMYSSDGGETYNPVFYSNYTLYGTYETVETNAELGESTIKITALTRFVTSDRDSATSGDSADQELLKNNDVVGSEIILGADHKTSEILPFFSTKTAE